MQKLNKHNEFARCHRLASWLAAFVFVTPITGFTENSGNILVHLTAHKIVANADGHESLESADQAKPGDIILYRATYHNTATTPVNNLLATLPIPNNLDFLPDTATPNDAHASLDAKTFAPIPLKRIVKNPDGTDQEQLVPFTAYRALRWTIGDLAAGQTVTASARVRVSTPATQ